MRLNHKFNQAVTFLVSLTLFLVFPLLVSAQTDEKKPAPPPKAQKTAPATQKPATPPAGQKQGTPPAPGVKPVPNASVKPTGGPGVKAPTTPVKAPGTTPTASGGKSVTTAAGNTIEYNKTGHVDRVVTHSGNEAHFDSRGRVHSITTANGTRIVHAPGGQRLLVTERADHTRVVSYGRERFVEHRSFDRAGRPYMRRTYVYGGRTYVNVYRGDPYRGVVYYRYVPAYYFGPAYYGWAYNPWGAPVRYNWGWYVAGWYAPYGYYFAPYPVYPSAAFWLTDYLIAANLQAAYEAQAQANANAAAAAQGQADASAPPPEQAQNGGAVTLTPEVKQMIADEVKAQLAAEQSSAQNNTATATPASAPQQAASGGGPDEVPPALDPNIRMFIVTTSLDVAASNGDACSLSPGDVLMRTENVPDSQNTIGVNVISSQKADCAMGSASRVQVSDLQDMHNHFREQIDGGMKTLADNQGKNGVPAGPAGGTSDNPDFKSLPTAPDLSAAADLKKQQDDADQSEKDVQQATPPANGTGGGN